jgi:hypothetical protein
MSSDGAKMIFAIVSLAAIIAVCAIILFRKNDDSVF